MFYKQYGKRLFDLTIAGVLLFAFSPIILLCIFILSFSPPIFFRQERTGLHGNIFRLFKFRSMDQKFNAQGVLLPDSQRVTPFGKVIRKFSFDELLQLLNVLKGEMSLVGPRPLLPEYLPRYSERQANRHLVKPGITGLAQIKGRNSLNWEEKFEYDLEYVENVSFLLDLKILVYTPLVVLRGDGIQHKDQQMPPFMGSEKQ